MTTEEKKKQQLCGFVSLLQAMGYDVISFDGNSLKIKEKKDDR